MTESYPYTVEQVERRMPTLALIEDDEIRRFTAEITTDAPAYFWHVPASTSGYHHRLCRRHRGLWLHTLMLSTVIERLADSFIERYDDFDQRDVDRAHSCAILHDQRKNGPVEDTHPSSTSDHDLVMADVVRSEYRMAADDREAIADAIASHMGPWYDGPEPETPLERLVHTADMIASTTAITVGVYGPIPNEFANHDCLHVIVPDPEVTH